MTEFDYAEYLASDAWKQIRGRVRRRARGWCERCKVGRRDDIHHLTYARIGRESTADLVAVCRECHEFLHGLRDKDPAETTYSEEEVQTLRARARYAREGLREIIDLLPRWYPGIAEAWAKREDSIGKLLAGAERERAEP